MVICFAFLLILQFAYPALVAQNGLTALGMVLINAAVIAPMLTPSGDSRAVAMSLIVSVILTKCVENIRERLNNYAQENIDPAPADGDQFSANAG
jgi:hypothetical protein